MAKISAEAALALCMSGDTSWEDEFVGDCSEIGEAAALFRGSMPLVGLRNLKDIVEDGGDEIDDDECDRLKEMAGAIYRMNDQGFDDLTIYTNESELEADWNNLVGMLELNDEEKE